MRTRIPHRAFVPLGAITALLVAACASGTATPAASTVAPPASDAPSTAPTATAAAEQVEITVVSLIPGSEQSAFDAFEAQVQQFEDANPGIDVTSQEYEWTGPTFAAMLAGGTLPDVFTIPFTDGKSLIEQGVLADISAEVGALPYADRFNPNVLAAGQDASGKIFAVPSAAYGIGLQYNRTLFEEAGLDPDVAPTTWEEIRSTAKTVAEATDQAGFAQMTQSNTGGWMLTTLTYANGGRMQSGTGGETLSTIDNPGTRAALETLRSFRWDDESMGSNFLLDWGGINQEFAAGKIGMYMGGSDVYTSLRQQNDMDPDSYGLAALPLSDDPNAGLLGGGTLVAVDPRATDAERAAAVKWIDFYYIAKLLDEDAAVLDAQTLSEAGQPVGVPALPIFDKETYDQSLEWIADYVNVPTEQMTSFREGVFEQPLVPEPAAHTQEMYAILDTVVQSVLTDESADVDALLADADSQVQALIDAD